ncbi:MAG: YeeE/YedE family protein [Betaproteobacteria bacterium]|nr:YeeE/YedE family protein [Betaproteobacteria bacterium]
MIDIEHFTPWSSLAGGLLIGVAAAMFLLFNGRVAGISGILGGLLRPAAGDIGWRIAFVAGLLGAPVVYGLAARLPQVHVDASVTTLVVAGLLVGAGTRYGSGCTSGHGVCGLSRLSPRSMVATASFMLAGFVTVFIMRHLIG